MTDSIDAAQMRMADAAAAFLTQALEIDDSPSELAQELAVLKRDANAIIFTIQLDSTVGPAAFLIYTYLLAERGGDGNTGQQSFDLGVETLRQAAERKTPGPRAVASATTDEFGFILATTPGTYRALVGDSEPHLEPSPEELPSTSNTDQSRADAAEQLLDLLKRANDQATIWLTSIQTATAQAEGTEDKALITFSGPETELALFLLDDDSIGNLLRSMNLLVATAQEQTQNAMADLNQTMLPDLPDDPSMDGGDADLLDPTTTWPDPED